MQLLLHGHDKAMGGIGYHYRRRILGGWHKVPRICISAWRCKRKRTDSGICTNCPTVDCKRNIKEMRLDPGALAKAGTGRRYHTTLSNPLARMHVNQKHEQRQVVDTSAVLV